MRHGNPSINGNGTVFAVFAALPSAMTVKTMMAMTITAAVAATASHSAQTNSKFVETDLTYKFQNEFY